MPDKTYIYMKVVSLKDWSDFLSKNSNKYVGVHYSNFSSGLKNCSLEVDASFVSEYFIHGLKAIIKNCCLEKLSFLCFNHYNHEFHYGVDSLARMIFEGKIYFTVIDNDYFEIINQINLLLLWCRNNPSEAVEIFDLKETQEDIIKSMDNSSFLLNPARDSLNRFHWNKSSKLLFDFLFTVKKLLVSAQESNNIFISQVVDDYDVSLYNHI